jgi:uncharacterized protein
MHAADYQLRIVTRLADIDATMWDSLEHGIDNPFLRHAFLSGLEEHGCAQPWGWQPCHLTLWQGDQLQAAMPLYRKSNSYGELVFDWAWADAYQRAGLSYYPKLVSGVPYSPVTGPRLLCHADSDRSSAIHQLIAAALDLARDAGDSSLHILFPTQQEIDALATTPLLRRMGTQFHWHNHDYGDFSDFLATFSHEKRKKLKRERRRVADQGITVRIVDGTRAAEEDWLAFDRFYRSTFERKSGYATLTPAFFRHLAATMPTAIVLMLADYRGQAVAGALSLRSSTTLYGRHWGCDAEFDSLHFELCYYQGIDYCIHHQLARFEPGAQGEHKVARGFLPTATWSAHWLADHRFHHAIARYLAHEEEMVSDYQQEIAHHLPYKQNPIPPQPPQQI